MKKLSFVLMLVFTMGAFSADQDSEEIVQHYLQMQVSQEESYALRKSELEASYCENAMTTPSINRCLGLEVSAAEIELSEYLLASIDKLKDYAGMTHSIHTSQKAWLIYREKACDAVYQQWIEGTIRGVMHAGCKLRFTQVRTHYLWQTYLTYMDSATPDLTEPHLQ